MSPHLPDPAMENPSLLSESSSRKTCGGAVVGGGSSGNAGMVEGILLDTEDRSSGSSVSLPSLAGLPLRIRSASLPALIELCIMCFDEDGGVLEAATNFPNIFFLMHKWFTTSESLAHDLRVLFEAGKACGDYVPLLMLPSPPPSLPPPPPPGQAQPSPASDSLPPAPTSFSRPPSVILPRKQSDDCNGNVGSRSPSMRNGRSNSVLIPRPACVGVEDDNYFSYHFNKLHALADSSNSSNSSTSSTNSSTNSSTSSSTSSDGKTSAEKSCPGTSKALACPDHCKHRRYWRGKEDGEQVPCSVYKFRRMICHTVRFWIVQFPVHFDMDPKLSTVMKEWQKWLAEQDYAELAALVDLSCLPSYDWIRNISVRDPSVKHCRKVSLVFNHLEPSELAKHLTYLEHRIMRRISFQDYKQYAVTGSLSDNPRLERSVNLFNGLTQWVQCMVLSRSTPQQRAEVIVKLIDVTKKLKELRNFNSLMAVVGGLSHSSLARLARTAARVPADSQRTLADLTEFLSSSANFSNYRRALQECQGFTIPILGVHMKDLISLHVALSDAVEGGLINFRKMAQLSLIFQELQELQNATPPPGANVDLVNTLRVSLELAYTEDEIYELSLAREPRDSLSPQCSPTRPSLLGDWPTSATTATNSTLTTGNAPPSPILPEVMSPSSTSVASTCMTSDIHSIRLSSMSSEQEESGCCERKKTLEERMNDMVDAVFGAPKHELLKLIHQRADGDVAVDDTQPETTSGVVDVETDVKHDFQETSSFRPCTCAHCNGLLWGPLRQGYKCKECGLVAHKMCKDVMNVKCRPKSLVAGHFSDTFQGGSARPRFRRRKKLSSQSDMDNLESRLLGLDCCCDLSCPSPCRSMAQPRSSCDPHFQDRLAERGGCSSESSTPVLAARHQIFRSPKRRSLIPTTTTTTAAATSTTAAATLTTAAVTSTTAAATSTAPAMTATGVSSSSAFAGGSSPVPIRYRKSSLSSFTTSCRSFPGTDPSMEGQSPGLRSSLPTSPRRKISDTLQLLTSTKSPCTCQGHH